MYLKEGAWKRRAVEDAAPDDQGWMWADGGKDAPPPLTEVRGANFEGVAPQESGAGRGEVPPMPREKYPLREPWGGHHFGVASPQRGRGWMGVKATSLGEGDFARGQSWENFPTQGSAGPGP